jgi:hypothetical protein
MIRCQKNNNPANLRFAHQKEAAAQDDKGFAVFPDPPAGWRALHAQIRLDRDIGLTLGQFIAKYAPPNENDTSQYLEFVSGELRMSKDTPLTGVSIYALAGVMAQEEGYYNKEA